MTDNKTIGISTLITIGIVLASMIGPTFFENPQYYCEDKGIILECPGGLSSGKMTRCYLTEEKNSWNYCKTGWLEITDDLEIQEEEEEINQTKPDLVFKKFSGTLWDCNPSKCVMRG